MAICSNCIIPDNYPEVEISDGTCSFCKLNEQKLGNKPRVNRMMELQSLLKNNNQNKYECIVPLSGGKDSTYILYYLVKNLKLNPLAVYFDNGFATDDAKHNVEEICKKLNVDLVKKPATIYRRKLIEEKWYLSFYSGKLFNFCGNCENNIRTVSINEGLNRGIKYIIWGSTDYEDSADELLNPSEFYRDSYAGKGNFKQNIIRNLKIFDKLFTKGNIPLKSKMKILIHQLKFLFYSVMDNFKLKAPEGIKKFNPYLQVSFKNKKTETIYFYDYIPYDPFHQIQILEREVGWKAPSGREAKMDCKLHHISNFDDLIKTGITNSGFKLSVLVRNGMISREEATIKEKQEVEFLKSYYRSENLEIQPALQVIKDTIWPAS